MQILMPSKSELKTFTDGIVPFSIPNGWPVRSSSVPVQAVSERSATCHRTNFAYRIMIRPWQSLHQNISRGYIVAPSYFPEYTAKKKTSHFKDPWAHKFYKLRWKAFVSYVESARSGHIATADNMRPDSMEILGSNVITF